MSSEKETEPRPVEDGDGAVVPKEDDDSRIASYFEEHCEWAKPVPGFVPNRDELIAIAKHWVEIQLNRDFGGFCLEATGSSDWYHHCFAWIRIEKIEAALGDKEVVRKAIEDAYEEFGKKVDPLSWKVYRGKASPAEKTAFAEKNWGYRPEGW